MENGNGQINLAKIVSHLANERTILAYMRTFLATLATGIAFQEFFHKPFILVLGQVLIGLSLIVLLMGVLSFIKIRKKIKQQKESVSAQFLD